MEAEVPYALAALAAGAGDDGRAAALAALCDVLAVAGPALLQAFPVAELEARLPALVASDSSGDVPLLAARAIAEACEAVPQWAARFAAHGAVQALRDRLLAIDYMELAEECLRALDAISLECPDECLRHGVATAALCYFDFFSTSKQKLALSIVANVFTDYDYQYAATAMEAAPALCNLLQYADKTILESAVSCLAKIASGVCGSADYMDRLCECDAVAATMRLMNDDGWKNLSDDTLYDILELLKYLATASVKAVKHLFELDVYGLLKEMITYYSCAHSDYDKLQMLMELIYHLIPPLEKSDNHAELIIAKKSFITGQSAYADQLASIITLIVQVAKSGAISSICHICVVVIHKIVELSTPTFLMELHNTVSLSSFLACLLARKNRHIVFQTLMVSKALLEKQHQFFFGTFSKEGVKQAIHTIQAREKDTSRFNHKSKTKNTIKECCLCFYLDMGTSSTNEECRIEKNAILKLADEIKQSFLVVKGSNEHPHRFGFVLKSVQDFFARLNGCAIPRTHPTENPDLCKRLSDNSRRLLLNELPGTSTCEFVESGTTKYLAGYLSNGVYFNASLKNCEDLVGHHKEVQSRLQIFTHLAFMVHNESSAKPLGIFVEKLLDALHMCYDSFPVIQYDGQCTRVNTMIPLRHSGTQESTFLHIKFVRSHRETELQNYDGPLPVDLYSTPDAIEAALLPLICKVTGCESTPKKDPSASKKSAGFKNGGMCRSSRLKFSFNGQKLEPHSTFFESILRLMNEGQSDVLIDPSFWDKEHKITYKRRSKSKQISSQSSFSTHFSHMHAKLEHSWLKDPFFSTILLGKLPGDLYKSDPSYDFLFMLKVLEGLNRFLYHISMDEQTRKFAEGCLQDLDLKATISPIPRSQFISNLLTNKLELQMRDSLFEKGLIPSWCVYLVETCPFVLSFSARWKYFCLTMHRSFTALEVNTPPGTTKYSVIRSNILEGAASVMNEHRSSTKIIEVEFEREAGTGRGPTLEFYTAASHELQRAGLGMWRGDVDKKAEQIGSVLAPFGLFPQPWSSAVTSSGGIPISDVLQKFKLLGHLVARAVLDGRILDIPLSKAFYKIMLEQELDIYDIPSFDHGLGKTLLEFQALVKRKKFLETSLERTSRSSADLSYKTVRLEDLCLDFTLPGNPEYELVPGGSDKMVTIENLEEYVSLVVDATLKSGITKQIKAFKSGINEVFALKTLKMFTEEEMEHILCGEKDAWASHKLEDHIGFEHGYDVSSPSIINFLEVLRDFGREDQRAFLQFTTGAPQLPLGGLASLDPKLTVVRKQCDGNVDNELPSVNTCRHFIKLPPYTSKEIMRKKLKYAISEGLGSFHLS